MLDKALIVVGLSLALTIAAHPLTDVPDRSAVDSTANELIPIADMNASRAAHTMTRLLDGRVLVVGGMPGETGKPAETAIFDPSTRAFKTLASAPLDRQSHTASLLPDGRVLITGGFDKANRGQRSTFFFDPKTERFSDGPNLPHPVTGQTATTLQDGRVVLIGGMTEGWRFVSDVVLFDPSDESVRTIGRLETPRGSHTATLLPDGQILVAAGHTGPRRNLTILKSAELFDPATGTTRPTGDLQVRRHKHDAVLLDDGTVRILGGSDERDSRGTYDSTEIFDPATGTFEKSFDLIDRRYKHRGTSIKLPDGSILIGGGSTSAEVVKSKGSNRIDGADNLRGQFSSAVALDDGSVLITGGYRVGKGPTSGAWLFVPGS